MVDQTMPGRLSVAEEALVEQVQPKALPQWYDPARPLIAFVDGPRDRSWEYADHFAELQRLAVAGGEQPATSPTLGYTETRERRTHRLHSAVVGTVWRWHGEQLETITRDRTDANAPTWLDKL